MKTKFLISSLILFLPLTLVSCGSKGAKSVTFKELTFKDSVGSNERNFIITNIMAEISNVKKVSVEAYEYEYTKHQETTINNKGTITLYNDYYSHMSGETNYTYVNAGVTLKKKTKIQRQNAILEDKMKLVALNENDDKQTWSISEIVEENLEAEKSIFNLRNIKGLIPYFDEYSIYKDGKGYVFTYSEISDNYTPVHYDGENREQHDLEKTQSIIKINAKFQITSYTEYLETITNRDKATNEWYKKDKTIEKSTVIRTFSYGAKNYSNKKEKLVNEFNNGYFITRAAYANLGKYDYEGASLTPDLNKQYLSADAYYSETNISHFVFNCQLTETNFNAVKFVLSYGYYENLDKDAEAKNNTVEVQLEDASLNYAFIKDGHIVMNKGSMSINVSVSLDLSLSGEISNLKIVTSVPNTGFPA